MSIKSKQQISLLIRQVIEKPNTNESAFATATLERLLNNQSEELTIKEQARIRRILELTRSSNQDGYVAVSEPDKGQSNAINKGMKLATGEVLHWLNSDDILEPNTLLNVGLKYLKCKFDLLAGTCSPFDNETKAINNRHTSTMPFGLRIEDITDIKATWLKGMYFHQPEVFFSRRIWEAAGGYVDEDLHYSMDYDLWARMALNQDFIPKLYTSGKSFCLYREHRNQKTSSVDAYLPELLQHSNTLRQQHLGGSTRSDFSTANNYRHKLSIVAISDFGFNGGAGIAHKRVCQVLQAAGHDVLQLSGFNEWQSEATDQPVEAFLEALQILKPDLVLLGNLHNLKRGLEIVEQCIQDYPTIAIAHDFWWITGRCAYTHGCQYLFTRCTNACPTPQEYPRLNPMEIHIHHHRKKQLLQNQNFYIQTNSSYTQNVFNQAVSAWGVKTNRIGVVSLPVVSEGDTHLQFPSCISKDSR
ncbi:MAG: glycosyltransferase, partial [Proteobacteria bacterium]|nr:glycosyltransferase [Pseudomonadota bacterium]